MNIFKKKKIYISERINKNEAKNVKQFSCFVIYFGKLIFLGFARGSHWNYRGKGRNKNS